MWLYMYSRSFTFQYSHVPFGIGRIIINGNFFSSSSFSAIRTLSIINLLIVTNGSHPLFNWEIRNPIILVFSYLLKIGYVVCSGSTMVPFSSRLIRESLWISSNGLWISSGWNFCMYSFLSSSLNLVWYGCSLTSS